MLSTWAVDLKDVAAVYPWQGLEVIMVLAAVAFWILWHIVQIRKEEAKLAEEERAYGDAVSVKGALEKQHSTWG